MSKVRTSMVCACGRRAYRKKDNDVICVRCCRLEEEQSQDPIRWHQGVVGVGINGGAVFDWQVAHGLEFSVDRK